MTGDCKIRRRVFRFCCSMGENACQGFMDRRWNGAQLWNRRSNSVAIIPVRLENKVALKCYTASMYTAPPFSGRQWYCVLGLPLDPLAQAQGLRLLAPWLASVGRSYTQKCVDHLGVIFIHRGEREDDSRSSHKPSPHFDSWSME